LFIKKSDVNKSEEVGCSSTNDSVGKFKETDNTSNDGVDKTNETGNSNNNDGVNKGKKQVLQVVIIM
jgi:hypothetical protein